MNHQAVMDQAKEKYDRGDFVGAIALLRSMVEHDPDIPNAWVNLALVYTEIEASQSAIDCYSRAIDLGEIGQRTYRGVQYELEGRDAEARRDYEVALEADPDDVDALINLGTLLLRTEGPHASRPMLLRAAQLDPKAGWQLADAELELGNVGLAISALQLAVAAGESRAASELEGLRSAHE